MSKNACILGHVSDGESQTVHQILCLCLSCDMIVAPGGSEVWVVGTRGR